jgi:hypothetical protein
MVETINAMLEDGDAEMSKDPSLGSNDAIIDILPRQAEGADEHGVI